MTTPPTADRPILADADAERALAIDGYTVLPLIDATDAGHLLDRLTDWVPHFPEGFYASVHMPDAQLRMGINALLMSTFRPLVDAICNDANLLGGALINKAPGLRGALPPHRDWNIVDETRHRAFNVWVPLADTNAANGAISVLPGSHRWLPTIRGPDIPCVFREAHPQLRAAMKLLPMRVGEVLIYDYRLFHCSDTNTTQDNRPGAVMGLVPVEAELKHYVLEGGRIRRYRSNVDFLLDGQTPSLRSALVSDMLLDQDSAPLSGERLAAILSAPFGQALTMDTDSP